MLMDLGEGLRQAIAKLSRSTIIDTDTVDGFCSELQATLLSSDVEVDLAQAFVANVKERAMKGSLPKGVTPKDYITNIVYDELVRLVGKSYVPEFKRRRILLMGLYGSGKTTTAAKLAKFYQDRGLSAALICCDVSRPAAYEQLETLAGQANVPFFGISGEKDAAKIARQALERFKDKQVVICDTSGRNAFDDQLVSELRGVAGAFVPDEKLLVVSADTGQVAGRQARKFDSAVKLSGVIITKMDGSAKGGGALSATAASGTAVMFIGTGEKLNNMEPFDANKYIGSLLGIPNIGALVLSVQEAVKEAKIKPEEANVEELNFESFYMQLKAMSKMGPLKNVFGMLGAPDVSKDVVSQSEGKLKKYEVIIASMTNAERRNEKLLHEDGRIRRIANGSGTSESDVNALISDFNKMKKVFNMLKGDRGMRRRFAGLA
jgi:signal recognition particle subunit SRP54